MQIKKIYNKNNYIILLVYLLCSFIFIQSHSNAELKINQFDKNYINLSYYPEIEKIDTIITSDGIKLLMPTIKDASSKYAAGSPNELFFVFPVLLDIPFDLSVESYEVFETKRYNLLLAPVPMTLTDYKEEFVYSSEIYNNHTTPNWVKVNCSGKSQQKYLSHIVITAARLNKEINGLEIPKRIDVVVKINYMKDEKYKKNNEILSNRQDLNTLSNGQWLRMAVKTEGVYRITSKELSNYGINISPDLVKTIKVFGGSGDILSEKVSDGLDNILNEQEIIVNTNSNGELEDIFFYGSGSSGLKNFSSVSDLYAFRFVTHYLNYMDNSNYYLLTFGGDEGKRAAEIEVSQLATYKPDNYIASIFSETDLIMPSLWGNGRIFLGNSTFNTPFINQLYNVDYNADIDTIYYNLSLAHVSNSVGEFIISFAGNNDYNSYISIGSSTGSYEQARLQTSYVGYPINTLTSNEKSIMNIDYSGYGTAIPYLNYYEIHYPRKFAAIDGEISFFTNNNDTNAISEYNITGFSKIKYGFDVTDASNPKLLKNISQDGNNFTFKSNNLDIHSRLQKKHFFISSNIKQVESIESIVLDNLRGEEANADIIVVTANSLLSSAEKFADYRSKQSGYRVKVVTVDKIYNEFSHSRLDVTAIRDYIQYAYNHWVNKPKFVVLWGLGHYDMRLIENKTPNLVPTFQRDNRRIAPGTTTYISDNQSCYASDDYYVCVDGDDWFADLAIGRVPIVSNEEGEIYINKLDLYENKSDNNNWRTNIILFADDDIGADGRFEGETYHDGDAERISNLIPDDFRQKKIYSAAYPVEIQAGARRFPEVTEEVLHSTNIDGGQVLFYTGHGNPNILMHEQTITRENTLQRFSNSDKLFYFMASSCEVGRFDKSGTNCIGREIVMLPYTGAIASLSATRVSGISPNNTFFQYIYKSLFDRDDDGNYITIGENLRRSKYYYDNEPSAEALMYVLLGDPSLSLLYPNSIINIDKINDIEINNDENDTSLVDIKALSKIKINGRITNSLSNDILSEFNGTVILSLNEANIEVESMTQNAVHKFIDAGATLNKSAFPVINGSFEAEFVVPGDVNFSNDNAILYAYAFSNDNHLHAKGVSKRLRINDIDTTLENDNNGPDIKLFIDNRLFFRNGDVVSQTPLLLVDLQDETGLNVTGLGIGHKLEAWVDNNPNPLDLTHNFVSSLDNPCAGSISKYLYNLEKGKHTVKVRAWDVFNNYSEEFVDFIIPEENYLISISLAPNPLMKNMISDANLIVRYNFVPPVNIIEFEIINSLGDKIAINNQYINNNIFTTQTVGILPLGDIVDISQIGAGCYYYRIKCSVNGSIYEKFGPLGIIIQ